MTIIDDDTHAVNPTPAVLPRTGNPDVEPTFVDEILAAGLKAAAEADTLPEEPTADDLAELNEWAAETTAREHLDRSATLGLAELVDHQVTFFRSWSTAAGEMIARHLEALALKIRLCDASTPEDYADRAEVLDAEARQQWEDIGFEQGKAAARAERERKHGRPPTASFGGHPAWED
jgi:hypothetical protein